MTKKELEQYWKESSFEMLEPAMKKVHEELFSEENYEEFRKKLINLKGDRGYRFICACLFLIEEKNISSENYTSAIRYVMIFAAIESLIKNNKPTERIKYFFNKYLSRDDKIKLLNDVVFSRRLIPLDEKEKITWKKDKENLIGIVEIPEQIRFIGEERDINSEIKKIAHVLYHLLRCKIVHEGNINYFLQRPLPNKSIEIPIECASEGMAIVLDESDAKFFEKYGLREKDFIRLKDAIEINNFKQIITNGFKRYYKKQIKKVEDILS